jgi:hypothetical protein
MTDQALRAKLDSDHTHHADGERHPPRRLRSDVRAALRGRYNAVGLIVAGVAACGTVGAASSPPPVRE